LTLEYPIVAGYRVDRQDPWRRRLLSRGYNWLVRKLLGTQVRDCDCALKIFRSAVLDHIMPETDGFFVNAEMLCKANRFGIPIAEVGVRHRPRRHGSSKVSLFDVPRTLWRLLPFWLSHVVLAARPQPVSLPEAELPAVSSRRSRSRRPIQPR
jgi:hypothetical protein